MQIGQNTVQAFASAEINGLIYRRSPKIDDVVLQAAGSTVGQMIGTSVATKLDQARLDLAKKASAETMRSRSAASEKAAWTRKQSQTNRSSDTEVSTTAKVTRTLKIKQAVAESNFSIGFDASDPSQADAATRYISDLQSEGRTFDTSQDNYFNDTFVRQGLVDTVFNGAQYVNIQNRIVAGTQIVGAGLEISGGILAADTGIGAIPGALMVTNGIDNLIAGTRSLISGRDEQTGFENIAQSFGIGLGKARLLEAGMSFAAPVKQLADIGVAAGLARFGVFGVENAEALANKAINRVQLEQEVFSAESPNAADALSAKYRTLEAAQTKSVRSETLSDGRIRYYKSETRSSKPGPTRGAAYVTEYDPKTGDVYTWMESYDQLGNVNRIHPKLYNGQELRAPHYPPTLNDKLEAELYSSNFRR